MISGKKGMKINIKKEKKKRIYLKEIKIKNKSDKKRRRKMKEKIINKK